MQDLQMDSGEALQSGIPNSLLMSMLEDNLAEKEADRLSEGVKGKNPDIVKSGMGKKLGTDFSGVQFHTDADAASKADSMGARAFTSGRDVYFGTGGFDGEVAAHELVHTAQQGAVGPALGVSVSAPAGRAQMWPSKKGLKNKLKGIGNWFKKLTGRSHNAEETGRTAEQRDAVGMGKTATSNWVKGISPAAGILKQLEADEVLSSDEREKAFLEEEERFYLWDDAHKQQPGGSKYEGAAGMTAYSNDRNYKIINAIARTGVVPEWLSNEENPVSVAEAKDMMEATDAIRRGMNTGEHTRLEKDRVVYRGIGAGYNNILRSQIGGGNPKKSFNEELSGQIVSDHAFTSTTMNPEVASDFAVANGENGDRTIIQAHLPKGMKTQYITPVSEFQGSDSEYEMLLDQDAPFRIIDASDGIEGKFGQSVRKIRGAYLRGLIGGHRRKNK